VQFAFAYYNLHFVCAQKKADLAIPASIVEICHCTKCYMEPVAPETSPVYSCYLYKLEIEFRSNSNPVNHLLFIARMFPCINYFDSNSILNKKLGFI